MDNREFFNNIAEKWDSMCCHPEEKVNHVFDKIKLEKGNYVLDIGSGTGIIIPYIEKEIGEGGKLVALDLSEKMIEVSKKKNDYKNLSFHVGDFNLYNPSEKYDCIIAYSCYPHFNDREAFFKKANFLLKKYGKVVIAHIESRQKINSRHNDIEEHIHSNDLVEVNETSNVMKKFGFDTMYTEDNKEYYICIGKKSREV
ncbi:class I SAM-dependent methyltransferase [Clostridium sp. P21]|uniref:Class I SAM-dependent methyltransferase n=1 Tax=Clostridium muellerianum TaxID=2716538 RepID=A0A7Y0EE20_9CLOT|nr:class I SAM-dependent methyltransferase [Clostridium muellerianum]NMM61804.1 class I SAM-dependent methyltransferase [Clostridium muellerianum]